VAPRLWTLWGRTPEAGTQTLRDLTPDEVRRAATITDQVRRAEFLSGSQLAREVVQSALDVDRGSISIDRTCADCGGPHGRPVIRPVAREGAHASGDLSISHSAGWTVVAFVRDGRVGIDIEDRSRSLGIESVARLILHPEEYGDGRRHDRDSLVHTWVQKESILKASGEGIRLPMSGMYLARDRLEEWDAHPEYVGKVELLALEAPPGLIGAAALIPPL